MKFDPEKCAKVTSKKGLLVKSNSTTLDMSTEITELEHSKTHEYFGISEANSIYLTINKEKK